MLTGKKLHCSFCGKSEDDVAKLVAGPNVYICDACVKIATEIMENPTPSSEMRPRQTSWRRLLERLFHRAIQSV